MLKERMVGWLALVMALSTLGPIYADETPFVVEITQAPCQFMEMEGWDRAFAARSPAHCRSINRRTEKRRMAWVKELVLEEGPTIFRVTNQRVSYPLGFYLRPARHADQDRLPHFSTGGLGKGETRDYRIDLKPGQYLISCPLNATLDYPVLVLPNKLARQWLTAVTERSLIQR